MGQCISVRCPSCGWDRRPAGLALGPDGQFLDNKPTELSMRIDHIGGRGKLRVERLPLPLPFALGLRDMLLRRLEQVEAELRAAGVEC